MKDIFTYTAEHPMPDLGISPDSGFPAKRAETSRLNLRVRSRQPLLSVTDVRCPEGDYRAPSEATVVLRDSCRIYDQLMKLAGEGITLVRRGDSVELTAKITDESAKGPAANAMGKIAKLLAKCDFDDRAAMDSLALAIDTGCGIFTMSWADEFTPTCVCGSVKFSDRRMEFIAAPRYYPTITDDAAEAIVRRSLASCGFDCEKIALNPGFWLSEEDALVKAMLDEYKQFTGAKDKDTKATYGFGGTYSRALKRSVSVGTMINPRTPELPEGHGGGHQPDEWLDIDAFLRACELITRMVLRENKLLEEGLA